MFPIITLFNFTCALLIAGFISFLYKFYIKQFLSLLHYKRQGAATMFNWDLQSYLRAFKYAETKGDFFYEYKELVKKNPKARFIAENFGPLTNVILVDPEMSKEFLRKYEIYYKNPSLFCLMIDQAKGSVIFAEGKEWKRKRKIISSAFNFEFLKDVVPLVISVTQKNFDKWMGKGESKDINLVESFGEITGELTGNFFFGKTFSDQKIEGVPITTFQQHSLNNTIEELFSIPTLIFGPKLFKANLLPRHKRMNQITTLLRERFGEMIRDSQKNKTKEKNLLNSFLELQESENESERLTTDEIIGEFIGLFSAGTDTTSHLLGSAMYFLYQNPRVFEKVKEEVDNLFSDFNKVDIESINKMDYTLAFLKESLRLGGPVIGLFDRVATHDDDLCGVKIRKGDGVIINLDLHFNSEKYYSRPQEIIPERWLSDPEFSKDGFKSEPYAFIPFSAGPRNCVGQHLATIEAKIILSLFIRTFDFKFSDDYKFVLVQRFTYETLNPLMATLKRK